MAVLFFSLLLGGFALLPDAALHPVPDGFASGIYTIYSYFASFNSILPVREILDLFLLTLTLEIAIFFWSFAKWIIRTVRGSK
jgi:hypothetical protein